VSARNRGGGKKAEWEADAERNIGRKVRDIVEGSMRLSGRI